MNKALRAVWKFVVGDVPSVVGVAVAIVLVVVLNRSTGAFRGVSGILFFAFVCIALGYSLWEGSKNKFPIDVGTPEE